jgi:replicative DNA helicase
MAMMNPDETGVRRRRDERSETLLKVGDGRVPPHDLDAEAAILSACLIRGTEAVDEAVTEVSPEDFYSEAHRQIFESAVGLAAEGKPVDLITVASDLKDKQRLGQVGGTPYIGQVADAAPVVTESHLRAYAQTVRGKARLRRLAHQLAVAQARCYGPMSGEQTEAFFSDLERDVGELCASRHSSDLVPVGPIVRDVAKDMDDHAKRGGGIAGIPTGFARLDRLLGGLHDGDLTIVAARPGLGKTALVMNICDNVTDRGNAGAVFSLEMPKKQLVSRMLCSRGRVDLAKMRLGGFSPLDWQKFTIASTEVFPKDIHIDDGADQSLAMIRSKLRRFVAKMRRKGKKVGAVIIDYLQLMRTRTPKGGENRSTLVGEITRGLKNLAKELSIPIVLLSQLNRAVEQRADKRPMQSDLRESGEIEQDADNIIFIYRDDHYFDDSEEPNVAELIVSKQRNGSIGVAKVRFDKQWTRFDNIAEGEYEESGS